MIHFSYHSLPSQTITNLFFVFMSLVVLFVCKFVFSFHMYNKKDPKAFVFSVWLTDLGKMYSKSIHFVTNTKISLILRPNNIPFYLDKYPKVELLAFHFTLSLSDHSTFKLSLLEENTFNTQHIGQMSSL